MMIDDAGLLWFERSAKALKLQALIADYLILA
jgi:hypothetical protein